MLDDNLNQEKLKGMIGSARFNSENEFKEFIKSKLADNFLLNNDRMGEKLLTGGKRYDLYVFDSLTQREVLVIIGLKTSNFSPALSNEQIEAFHKEAISNDALYGALMTETEVHFYEYEKNDKTRQPKEIKEIPPLNYVDAEFTRKLTPQKIKDLMISRKTIVIGIGLLLILLLAASLARASICKNSGPVKGEINSKGEKIYYLPDSSGYANRTTGDQPGERRFCQESQAMDDEWVKAK